MMAIEYVDSTQLDTDLTSVANAIRAKSGGSSQLAFPAGFVSEIGAIPSGGGGQTVYYAPETGIPYAPDIVLPMLYMSFGTQRLFQNASELVSVRCDETRVLGGSSQRCQFNFKGCTKLKTVYFPFTTIGSSYADEIFGSCPSLESATFGSVGYPISEFSNSAVAYQAFRGTTQSGLTITLFVNATTLADIPTNVTSKAPWGATNATIIYRNSTTGEVITA